MDKPVPGLHSLELNNNNNIMQYTIKGGIIIPPLLFIVRCIHLKLQFNIINHLYIKVLKWA